jgi:hypothetical protein
VLDDELMARILISPFDCVQYAPLRPLTAAERMQRSRKPGTPDPRLREFQAAVAGLALDSIKLRKKLIALGKNVAPLPPKASQFCCPEPPEAADDAAWTSSQGRRLEPDIV